jgi:DNA mismatch endonuclease (patch repair protein)
MVDRIDQAARSRNMSQIRSTDTRAEMAVRRIAHAMGYRFRIYRRDLPGTPDLTFPSRRVVLFVNGCFWHRHPNCVRAAMPKTQVEFWEKKFRRTMERDRTVHTVLTGLGWRVAVIWECEIYDRSYVEQLLRSHIERPVRDPD